MRLTYKYAEMTNDEAQRRRWTFYEAVTIHYGERDGVTCAPVEGRNSFPAGQGAVSSIGAQSRQTPCDRVDLTGEEVDVLVV
jgi:hypothetical protein